MRISDATRAAASADRELLANSSAGVSAAASCSICRSSGSEWQFSYKTYSNRKVSLWPPIGDPRHQISPRDIANNLAKINYHPEAAGAPFTAAQYACELASILQPHGFAWQLRALLANAFEAYAGHVPRLAREAERHLTLPAHYSDRRDELQDSLQNRVRQALGIEKLPADETGEYASALTYARWKLDATLERDLGASIYPPRDQMSDAVRRVTEPLKRRITPMLWINAMERYLKVYTELAVLAGVDIREQSHG